MKLYQTPGGVWCATEADWKKAYKAETGGAKDKPSRIVVEVPTDKKGLLEFLTFYNVHVIKAAAVPEAVVSPALVEALAAPTPRPVEVGSANDISVEDRFKELPISARLRLAVEAIDAADEMLRPGRS